MDPTVLYIATGIFCVAVIHTFLTKKFISLSHRFIKDSIPAKFCHFLGEVEIVFGFWAFIFIIFLSISKGVLVSVAYVNSVNFIEATFVFVIMCMAASKPIIQLTKNLIVFFAHILPLSKNLSFYCSLLMVGPLLGSFITEPAAMTVTALLLKEKFFDKQISKRFKYISLGLLFVNISVGGTLTNFAAPPIIMVAAPWGWSTTFMLKHFGWKSVLIIVMGTLTAAFTFRKELCALNHGKSDLNKEKQAPFWMKISHCLFMFVTVIFHNYTTFLLALFLIFIGWYEVTKKYQQPLKIKESLLVGCFLGGLVALGSLQGWWLQPLISGLSNPSLFLGSTILTAFTDNAALTYLATLVKNLEEPAKYALVSGAVAGGGLTVIANAPNPSGYGILKGSFGQEGISPLGLFLGALPFTILAMLAFWVL